MNKKIIVTIGISGSGKSTWAHNQWLKDPLNTVVINRDKIRELLFSYTEESVSEYYKRPDSFKLEGIVTEYEDLLISAGVINGKTVIVDATHLSKKYIERHNVYNVPVEKMFFDTPLELALKRNSMRVRKVNEDIIKMQFAKYKQLKKEFINESEDTD